MKRCVISATLLALTCVQANAFATSITQSALGVSAPTQIDVDHFQPGIGVICTLSSGASLTYTIQVSGDPVPPMSGITHWNDHDVLKNLTASMNDSIAFPVTAVRLNVTTWGGGSVYCAFVQSGAVQQFQWYQKGQDRP